MGAVLSNDPAVLLQLHGNSTKHFFPSPPSSTLLYTLEKREENNQLGDILIDVPLRSNKLIIETEI